MQSKEKETSVSYINTIKSFSLTKEVKDFVAKKSEAYTQIVVRYRNEYQEIFLLEKLKKEGLILSYGEGSVMNDYPPFYTVGVRLNSQNETQTSWGYVSLLQDKRIAYKKALYEGVERHACMSLSLKNIKVKDVSWLYDLIPLFSHEQTKKFPFLSQKKENLAHSSCVSVKKQGSLLRRTWLPAHLFYYGATVSKNTDYYIQQPTSNGGAVGQDTVSAKLGALCELIERDHFLLFWLSGIKPKVIENIHLSQSEGVARIVSDAKKYNLSVSFFDMTYDMGVPVVFCLCIDETLSLVSCGAKCGFDIDENIEGSFYEALSVLSTMRVRDGYKNVLSKEGLLFKGNKFLDKDLDRKKRVTYYSSPYGVEFIKKYFLTEKYIDYSDYENDFKHQALLSKKEQLAIICRFLRKKKDVKSYELFFREQKTKYTKMLNVKAFHAFVPAFLKLYLNEHFATPVSLRLCQFAEFHGKKILSSQDVNPHPHFFP